MLSDFHPFSLAVAMLEPPSSVHPQNIAGLAMGERTFGGCLLTEPRHSAACRRPSPSAQFV